MSSDEVLEMMKRYFAESQPAEVLASFAGTLPRALLKESLDVVDFVVFLEEELGRDIDITQLGEALLSKNFGGLAEEVSRMLAEG